MLIFNERCRRTQEREPAHTVLGNAKQYNDMKFLNISR